MERELVRSARWNSCNGRRLFHEGNRGFLASLITYRIPDVGDAKTEQNCVLVGFLQSMWGANRVYLPFLVLPKSKGGGNKNRLIPSGAIKGKLKAHEIPLGILNQIFFYKDSPLVE